MLNAQDRICMFGLAWVLLSKSLKFSQKCFLCMPLRINQAHLKLSKPFFHLTAYASEIFFYRFHTSSFSLSPSLVTLTKSSGSWELTWRQCQINFFLGGGGASRHGICSWSAMSSWSSQNSISNFTLPLTATGWLYKNITTPSILHQQSHVIQRWLVKYTKYFEVEVGVFVFLSSSFLFSM